jgi:hypothetical protein
MISGLPAVSAHRSARYRRTDFQRLRYAKHILWLAIVVSFWKESFNGDGKPLHPKSTNPTTTSYLKSLNHYIQYQQTQQPPLTSNHWTITSNISKPDNHLSPQITEQSKNDSSYEILQTTVLTVWYIFRTVLTVWYILELFWQCDIFWNCSDSVVYFRTVLTVWYILELFWQCGIF